MTGLIVCDLNASTIGFGIAYVHRDEIMVGRNGALFHVCPVGRLADA